MPDRPPPRLRFQISVLLVVRLIINTGFRMFYPFMPELARGVGVPFEQMALAINSRSALGLLSPLLGSLGDRRGRKFAMIVGLVLFSGGLLVAVLWSSYASILVALLLSAAGNYIFVPTIQAYVGDHVPYKKRGLVIGLLEISWSAAFLLGMPVIAWIIARFNWVAPFPLLAGLGFSGALVLWRMLPPDADRAARKPSFLTSFKQVVAHRPALAGLAVGTLIGGANELINIVFGVWLEGTFGLQIAALGAVAVVIGLSELSGEGLVVLLSDRVGLRRALAIGMVCSAAAGIAMPLLGQAQTGALVGLFLVYLTFEFTIVSSIPLMTELVPGARATLMASYISAVSGGRMLGGLVGPLLFKMGLIANGIGMAAMNLLALIILVAFVKTEQESRIS